MTILKKTVVPEVTCKCVPSFIQIHPAALEIEGQIENR
jgi:hypothetical protein